MYAQYACILKGKGVVLRCHFTMNKCISLAIEKLISQEVKNILGLMDTKYFVYLFYRSLGYKMNIISPNDHT